GTAAHGGGVRGARLRRGRVMAHDLLDLGIAELSRRVAAGDASAGFERARGGSLYLAGRVDCG
ncbi:MAG TPA: hypothetical protein PKG82_10475, partial [Myxococcota bacterium]|nr:hypothetical protein [Myxococcota bacterium]